jgi:acetolactate synthase I/II/III large subunit
MQRTGAQIIIDFLEQRGVRAVAGMPGGANLPLYDALSQSALRHVLVRHEQAAGFIAQGMARVSGRAQVCFATSGPGATNLVTALADARMDSVPLVAITGQVPTALLGTDAFQEVDTVSIVKPVVKHAVMAKRVAELPDLLAHCFAVAESGRPGPVLLDVPKDVQQAALDVAGRHRPQASGAQAVVGPSAAQLEQARLLLSAAERPILYVGGGVAQAGAHEALAALAVRQQIPVVCSLMGLGCFDPEHPLQLGMLGMHGAPYTNHLLREADLLLAVGARFDDRATGKLSEFCPRARTVHVDIDAREIGKLRAVELGIRCDARAFLEAFLSLTAARARPAWLARVRSLRERHPMPSQESSRGHAQTGSPAAPRCAAQSILRELGRSLDADSVITTDVGQHQMWVAQHLPIRRPRQLLTSGGLGSMGFGLPAAIGAALQTGSHVVCVTGDGSLLLNIQELATLAELDLDVTILLFDNQHLGLVRQQQTLFYGRRICGASFERPSDFVAIARAFGIAAESWSPERAASTELGRRLARRGPQLIHVPLDAAEMVLPMVPPGAANHEMLGAPVAHSDPAAYAWDAPGV